MKMLEFKSNGTYSLNGSIAFAVKNNKDRKRIGKVREDFSDLFPAVKIDGKVYKTKGIESFAISHVGEGQPIGIIVE